MCSLHFGFLAHQALRHSGGAAHHTVIAHCSAELEVRWRPNSSGIAHTFCLHLSKCDSWGVSSVFYPPAHEPWHCRQRSGALHDSASLAQKRGRPDSAASAAPTRRAGMPPSQALGRAPPAPRGAVDGRALSGQISKAGSTQELLRLSSAHSATLNHIHVANLWNKLGKQGDAFVPR